MIALTAGHRKRTFEIAMETAMALRQTPEIPSHGNVRGIILLPHFRPSPAPLACDKIILRWPGPFGSGFLSPQPPGAVGIGSVRRGVFSRYWGQRKLVLFRFADAVLFERVRSITYLDAQDCRSLQLR